MPGYGMCSHRLPAQTMHHFNYFWPTLTLMEISHHPKCQAFGTCGTVDPLVPVTSLSYSQQKLLLPGCV
jgi:hypothetical protein